MKAACRAAGENRARHYRRHRSSPRPLRLEAVPTPQPRALSELERTELLAVLHDNDHIDEAPATIYAKRLDEGTYLASVSTIYRVLWASDEVRERHRHATHAAAAKPELVATAPNAGWSWAINRLLGPEKWHYFSL